MDEFEGRVYEDSAKAFFFGSAFGLHTASESVVVSGRMQ